MGLKQDFTDVAYELITTTFADFVVEARADVSLGWNNELQEDTLVTFPFECIPLSYDAELVDGDLIEGQDRKLIGLCSVLAADLTPSKAFVFIDDVRHKIVSFKKDPAGATFTAQARRG